jgi:hypothetical protein
MDLDKPSIETLCTHIHSDKFWKIACKKKYNVSMPEETLKQKNFKNIFLEHYLQEYLKTQRGRSKEELIQMMSKIGPLIVDLKVTDHVFGEKLGSIFYYLENIRKLVLNVYSNTQRELKISNFGMSNYTFEMLTNCFSNFHALEELDLSNNQIDRSKIEFLTQNLFYLGKLSQLSLSKNKIDNAALSLFAEIWKGSLQKSTPQLQSLDLSHNNLDLGSGPILGRIIQANREKLDRLSLDGNLIENSDAQHIFNAILSSECELTHLNLSNNLINECIFGIFIDFIIKAKNIQMINLELNEMKLSSGQIKILNDTLNEVLNLQHRTVKVKIDFEPETK